MIEWMMNNAPAIAIAVMMIPLTLTALIPPLTFIDTVFSNFKWYSKWMWGGGKRDDFAWEDDIGKIFLYLGIINIALPIVVVAVLMAITGYSLEEISNISIKFI